jgi:hypothetical protein
MLDTGCSIPDAQRDKTEDGGRKTEEIANCRLSNVDLADAEDFVDIDTVGG